MKRQCPKCAWMFAQTPKAGTPCPGCVCLSEVEAHVIENNLSRLGWEFVERIT